jgi:hypothetical protein
MNPLERYVRRIVRQEIAAHNASQLPTGIPPALVGVPAYSGGAPEGVMREVADSNAKGRPSG